jgi:nicotinamidase-related amidase
MPAKTLVIVDMQPIFRASREPNTVIAVAHEIVVAKQNNHPIVIVEYAQSGRTHAGFDDLLKGYRHKARISKWNDDGSVEVIRALKRRNFPMQTIRVCGVNADCCVYETVTGLLYRLSKTQIEIVKKACNTESTDFNWREYHKHPNLRLV